MALVIVVCWSETRCSKRPKRLGTIVRRWLWKLFCFLFLSCFSFFFPFIPLFYFFFFFFPFFPFFFPEKEQRILLEQQTNEISFYEHSTTSRSWDRRVRGKRFENETRSLSPNAISNLPVVFLSSDEKVGVHVRFNFAIFIFVVSISISRVPFFFFVFYSFFLSTK